MSAFHLQTGLAYLYLGLVYLMAAQLQIAVAYIYIGLLHLFEAFGLPN
jgi:hypothetical protein